MKTSYMTNKSKNLRQNQVGGPLAEFALIIPLLLLLTFGAFEIGRMFFLQNMVNQSVQDAARYVARHPAVIDPDNCGSPGGGFAAVQANARTIVQNGDLASGTPLTADLTGATITVEVNCVSAPGTMETTNPGAGTAIPIVEITAEVDITDIGFFGFITTDDGITITAEHREMAIGL